ncbi:hypothetical protein A3G69_01135 [Candidatus Peribacteria bacterium RIFCSPLOWO2_12_FULL_53_10]|nr:MAG: hypothetical protein A3B61_02260 [Candidatus Peribacteria bacterium RIFCSPLOWO2_01_FULL_53_10]OGJ72792.1 MAG: hypothetical protein A3G69_01135 [Candidatus Peribacteria bacterium RIFCSPLOWO2_12_FULL_53_10]
MHREELEASVEEASRRYTNVTALYEGAEMFPTLNVGQSFSHEEIRKMFGGSCLEQLRAIEGDCHDLHFLRSTAIHDNRRSSHWAALTTLRDEEFLVDPNISPIPVSLREVERQGQLTIKDVAPMTSETRTQIVIAKAGRDGTYIVDKSKHRGEQEQALRHESFDVGELHSNLPNVIADLQTPLLQKKLLFEIALARAGNQQELLRILHDDDGTVLNLSGAGTKISRNRKAFDARFADAAQAYDTNAEVLQTVIHEAWQIYKKLQQHNGELQKMFAHEVALTATL